MESPSHGKKEPASLADGFRFDLPAMRQKSRWKRRTPPTPSLLAWYLLRDLLT